MLAFTKCLGLRHANNIENLISRTTTAALVIHPIGMIQLYFTALHLVIADSILAAGLTFLAFLISLFILHRGSNGTARLPSFLTLGIGLLAALLTTVIFLIDVIFVAVVRHKVHNASDGDLNLNWGNAVSIKSLILFEAYHPEFRCGWC